MSARSSDSRVHIGNGLKDAFATGGAGGHRELGGGQIPLGTVADHTDDEGDLLRIVERVITRRLVDGLCLSEEEAAVEGPSSSS